MNPERNAARYAGVIPAFYACYDKKGEFSPERARQLARFLVDQGVRGLYVCGSSGESLYLSREERMRTLEAVVAEVKGECTLIVHVACLNTRDSVRLAQHAQDMGVDAISALPPLYYKLPESAVARYWNEISNAAPETDFILYNIPQLSGVPLSLSLLKEMLMNHRVAGIKCSSPSVGDIRKFLDAGPEGMVVFNGSDSQMIGGLAMGAQGGIGGTYGMMPALFVKLYELFRKQELASAMALQQEICSILQDVHACEGSLYSVAKGVIQRNTGLELGDVRAPMQPCSVADSPRLDALAGKIRSATADWAGR